MYVQDNTPLAEARYRARFWFDPNGIAMAANNSHDIFIGNSGASTGVLRVEFRYDGANYQLRAALRNNASTWTNSEWVTISDTPHSIEVDWRAATSTSTSNGSLTLWIDGTQRGSISGIANDTRRIENVRLGPVSGIDPSTRGVYYLDTFVSRRSTYIGP
jgi:hypothetical protein